MVILKTGDGRMLPPHLAAELDRLRRRLVLAMELIRELDAERDDLLAATPEYRTRSSRCNASAVSSRSSTAARVARGKDIPYSKEYLFQLPMTTSKLTSKAQTTIPQPVRAALRLKDGDELAYEIEGNRVILTKASAGQSLNPCAHGSHRFAAPEQGRVD